MIVGCRLLSSTGTVPFVTHTFSLTSPQPSEPQHRPLCGDGTRAILSQLLTLWETTTDMEQRATELLFSRKTLMKQTFFLSLFISHTRTVTPRYQPPSMEDSVTSQPPGQRWILGQGLWVGGSGRSPCWRTPEESCKGLGSVTLKINTQHTHG